MKRRVFYGIWAVVTLLQAALVAGGWVLARLAYWKAGVNHHVAFRKRQYNQLLFSGTPLLLLQIAAAVLAVILLVLLVRAIRRRGGFRAVLALESLAAAGMVLAYLTAPALKAVRIYPYAVLIASLILLLALLAQILGSRVR